MPSISELALILLMFAVPLYSTWTAARVLGLFKSRGERAGCAIFWTFALQYLLFAMSVGPGITSEAGLILPFFVGYFMFGVIPAILCLGLRGRETYLFALAGALGATLSTAFYAICMGLAN